jgi:D-alanyl-D-alanine carboxypeptidase
MFQRRGRALAGGFSWRGLEAAGAVLALAGALLVAGPAEARYTSIVIDAGTGVVLHQDNADVRNYPASLTKMMTLYLTFEALNSKRLRLDQDLVVSQHAQNQAPSKLGLNAGDTIKVEDAIYAVCTKSANDIAVVLAETLGGSEQAFAAQMTEKARALGMARTTYRNATGLPNNDQMSTPRDLATLALALIRDWPQYYHFFGRTSFNYNGQTLVNHNHLMSRYPGMDGIKTGFINKSGFNLAASAVRDGHRLVGVVLGGPSARARDNYMASLLDAGFRRLANGKGAEAPALAQAGANVEALADVTPPSENSGAGDQDDDQDHPAPPAHGAHGAHGAKAPPATGLGHGGWVVQLGSYKSQAAGRRVLDQASRHIPLGVGHPSVALHRVGSHRHVAFHAQLVGFRDEHAAALTCARVKARGGHACTVARAGR